MVISHTNRNQLKIGQSLIGQHSPCHIIAEAGVNHNGSLTTAKQLATVAAEAGANALKIQTFKAQRVVSKNSPKAKYQLKSTDPSETQLEMLTKLAFPEDDYPYLQEHCCELGIEFFSTPYNEEDVDFLIKLGVRCFKLASISIVEPHFIKYVAQSGLPLILSTGMATLEEVAHAVEVVKSVGNEDFTLLQCTTNYPTNSDEVNLNAMITMREALGARVGYSDHTTTNTACIAAVALGAQVIEKHLTIDKLMNGPDHSCSEDPGGFKKLVSSIRETERCMGNATKSPSESEINNMVGMRRSLVAKRDISIGEVAKETDFTLQRPANGLPPSLLRELIGKSFLNAKAAGDFFQLSDFDEHSDNSEITT